MARHILTHDDAYASSRAVDRVDETHAAFDLHRVVALIAGLGFLLLGAMVLIDTGFNGFPDAPLTTAGGFTQTPLWGVIDLGVGLLLLVGAADWDRSVSTFTSGLMLVGGILVIVRASDLPSALVTERSFGWLLVIVGAVVLAVSLLVPRRVSRRRVVSGEQVLR